MEHKKVAFFKRVKNAIIDFDEYKVFAEEKVSVAIKYILKLILIFTLIIVAVMVCQFVKQTNEVKSYIETDFPEFSLQDNTLIIEGDNKKIVNGTEDYYFGFIVDSNAENITDVQEANDYQRVICFLKNRVVIRGIDSIENSITYQQINDVYSINNLDKSKLLEMLSGNDMIKIFAIFSVVMFIYLYIIYLVQILLDILLLSVVGYLLSRIVGLKFKYSAIFNMSTYALTLPIILYMLYIVLNTLTGFYIKLFDIAYNAISYIYIATAMLMIKSDLIKRQMELTQVIKVQKEVQKEAEEENKEDKEEKKEEDKKEKEDKDREKGTNDGQPQGT